MGKSPTECKPMNQDVDAPRGPDIVFPPPFLFLGGFIAGWLLERYVARLPLVRLPGAPAVGTTLGWLAVLAGAGLLLWAMSTFRRARTPVLPLPATQLVTGGPYALTRNPIYAGLSFLYVGFAIMFNYTWPLIVLPLVWAALFYLVIRREEQYLERRFGEEYAAYRSRVRRWL
jgi:protein-S-isoprenylcysteine O-methyltransferase Ste14